MQLYIQRKKGHYPVLAAVYTALYIIITVLLSWASAIKCQVKGQRVLFVAIKNELVCENWAYGSRVE